MIAAVVFSRDRPIQLDLLLTSLERNAPGVFDPIHVLWRATGPEYHEGYELCLRHHPEAWFMPEDAFASQVRYLLHSPAYATFLTDDDVLYRPWAGRLPARALGFDVACVSLRLGRNTDWCYPHGRRQELPRLIADDSHVLGWDWATADGDFGYPGSLDGHIFRGGDLYALLGDASFSNPNTLEDVLVARVSRLGKPRMAAYAESCLLGIPANRVNETSPNRNGETHPYDVAELNRRYLAGERIDLAAMDFSAVRGAHQELEFRFA